MRLKRQTLQIGHGQALICDPLVVGHDPSHAIADGATFELWEGNGEFSVYSDGQTYFIDVDPLILKANTLTQLSRISGRVGIDTAHIGVYDLSPERFAAADDAIADGWAIVIRDLLPGQYVAWFEEKGTAKELFRGVVGFGRSVKMLLNGEIAQQIQSLEDRIAAAYRLEGIEKQAEMRAIGEALTKLHLDGCKDTRLRMLADAIKLKLPRRPPRAKA